MRRGGLLQALDQQVNSVVRQVLEDTSGTFRLPTITQVYDTISQSKSSLHRKPKKVLEDSIERVLQNIRQEEVIQASRSADDDMNRAIRTHIAATVSLPQHDQQQTSARPAQKRLQATHELPLKRQKITTAPMTDRSPPTHISLSDLGGIDDVVRQLVHLLYMPLKQTSIYLKITNGAELPDGILIHGPPGCGKTTLVNALAADLGVKYIPVSAPSIVTGTPGESEKALRDLFEEAKTCAPCLVFIDEIDAISSKRENSQRETDKRIVSQLAICMDSRSLSETNGKPVIVLAATSRPDSLDGALRRGDRFGTEIHMPMPDEAAREKILQALMREKEIPSDFDSTYLAKNTPGFNGADLSDLIRAAYGFAMERCVLKLQLLADSSANETPAGDSSSTASLKRLCQLGPQDPSKFEERVTFADFLAALPQIRPTCMREGFATIPDTTFDDVGALSVQIEQLQDTIISPILDSSRFLDAGIRPSSGVLLWGPPGTGKTLMVRAIANSSQANFIAVNGPELMSKYVGDSEKAFRQLFARARFSVPVIVFIDEIDSFTAVRDSNMSEATTRVVSTLLTELDGVRDNRDGIYLIGATNRPDAIDPALLRPGRMDTAMYVGLPDTEGRVDILRRLCRRLTKFTFTEDIADIARSCERFSGADLKNLLRVASMKAARRRHENPGEPNEVLEVTVIDFQLARAEVGPSVSIDSLSYYERLKREF